MPDAEETLLRAAVTNCRRLSVAASYALMHAGHIVANDNEAYRKLVEADATASEQYTVARAALRTYRTTKRESEAWL